MAVAAMWGIDIGQCALKAVKARLAGAMVEVLAFDHIEYKQPLSTAGTDSSATIREALQTFLSRNDVTNCAFSVSIAAGRAALIRFIKLPPVDRRKVPDIVRYEATQQIPFPLEDVIWDHQVIERTYAPGEELEVGIFAMRREAIFDFLSNLMVSGIEVESIQLSAVALYNCVHFDQPVEDGAIMAVDIGAENTNLVVVDGNSVWTRSLPIGGNDFTRAVATKYSMDFEQAENLKRNMERSKKANEIFEALRPSLRSLLDEIQRSAGYYRSLHKSAKFVKLLGFGSGFKMFGVQRFLEAGLAYPVEVFQKCNNFYTDGAVNQQFFKKSAPAYGAALGLVAQGLGVGGINTTLMPPAIIKERLLKKKRPFLIAAAAMLAMAFAWPAIGAYTVMPSSFDIGKNPVYKLVLDKQQQQKKFNDTMNVSIISNDITYMMNTKARRAEQLDAFNALVESIPQDETYPVYIQALAMENGTAAWVNARLYSTVAEGGKQQEPTFTFDIVTKEEVIQAAAEAAKKRTVRRASADERVEALDRRVERQEAMREARLRKLVERRESGIPETSKIRGTRREDLKVAFDGFADMANLVIETSNPLGATYVRTLCRQLKERPGVIYCECVNVTAETFWENPTTRARLYAEPPVELSQFFKKIPYITAVIQWVYKPGGQAVAQTQQPAQATPGASEAPSEE